MVEPALEYGHRGLRGVAFWRFHVIYWLSYMSYSAANSLFLLREPADQIWRVTTTEALGAIYCLVIHVVLLRLQDRSTRDRALVGVGLAIPVTSVYVITQWLMYFAIMPEENIFFSNVAKQSAEMLARQEYFSLLNIFPRWFFLNFWAFIAWIGFYMAIDYARRVKWQEGKLVTAAQLAHDAQLKMLRFQLNPHFLFNTLNAISSLVLDQRNEEAENMLVRLSRFLRFTLESEPTHRIPLRDEIAAQRLYLEIEQARFGDRLSIEIDVDAAAADALVPSLLLQPLVENAIKYGISPSPHGGRIELSAKAVDGELELTVRDDGPGSGGAASKGSGVGLRNTEDRLNVLYGDSARMQTRDRPEGGFEVVVRVPLETRRQENEGRSG